MSFQTIPGSVPRIVVNLSKVQDPAIREVMQNMLRAIQDLQNQLIKTVNNNANQGQGAQTATFSNLAGAGVRAVKADANGVLSAP